LAEFETEELSREFLKVQTRKGENSTELGKLRTVPSGTNLYFLISEENLPILDRARRVSHENPLVSVSARKPHQWTFR